MYSISVFSSIGFPHHSSFRFHIERSAPSPAIITNRLGQILPKQRSLLSSWRRPRRIFTARHGAAVFDLLVTIAGPPMLDGPVAGGAARDGVDGRCSKFGVFQTVAAIQPVQPQLEAGADDCSVQPPIWRGNKGDRAR